MDRIEITAPLFDGMREVVNFCIVRLLVQVLEQNDRAVLFSMTDDPL